MTVPYDISALVAGLKTTGLNVTEDAAKAIVEQVCVWFETSAKLSATPFDDVALVVLPQFKAAVLKELDKIDGAVG